MIPADFISDGDARFELLGWCHITTGTVSSLNGLAIWQYAFFKSVVANLLMQVFTFLTI